MNTHSTTWAASAVEDPPAKATGYRPRLVVAHTDCIFAALTSRSFRRLGWEVHVVGTGPEARQAARHFAPEVVILATELPEESGWLTCDKLTRESPGQKVILVAPDLKGGSHQFATFVGASALVSRDDGVEALIDEVVGAAVPVAG